VYGWHLRPNINSNHSSWWRPKSSQNFCASDCLKPPPVCIMASCDLTIVSDIFQGNEQRKTGLQAPIPRWQEKLYVKGHPVRAVHGLWLKVLRIQKEKEKKIYVGCETTPYICKGKEAHWPKELWVPSTRENEDLVRIWMVTSSPLLQTKTLRATGFFKSASSSWQFMCIENRMSR